MDIVIGACDQSLNTVRTVVFYSHVISIILSLLLGVFVFIKAKYNFFSRSFFCFIVAFSIWLIGDLMVWNLTSDYYLIYTIWSFLLYIEVIFYTLGLYFTIIFIKKSDIDFVYKLLLFLPTLPPLVLTLIQKSVTGFNYPACEAFNSSFLDNYKLIFEGVILTIILIYTINPFFRKTSWKERWTSLVVTGSMFLFLSIFGVTEYLASVTGYYEMNLYSLFLLPVFLVAIIYSVFELDIFNVRILGTHYLVVGLVVLMAGQLFFITNTTNQLLTVLAMILAAILSIVLFRNLKKESDQRVQIQNLLTQRESLMHLINHKVKGAFTRSKYIFAGIIDGTFGEVNEEVKRRAKQGIESDDSGVKTIDIVLNAANLESGTVRYDMKPLDFKQIVVEKIADKSVQAQAKGLVLESNITDGRYTVLGDAFWLKEVVNNFIENSIRYTKEGKIMVNLSETENRIKFSVKDTGVGITDEDKKILFTEGGRGKDSVKINTDSTGYGLYSVKLIIEAHHGRVWAESEGPGKGSEFFVELPVAV